jgi:aldose 1-epimerase
MSVDAVVLHNSSGMRVRVIAFGAAVQALEVPDRHGHSQDIVLSYPDVSGFLTRPQYFGATIGRVNEPSV